MVLCGHHAGEALRTGQRGSWESSASNFSDYQHLHNGGESWLRYMVFKPSENQISVYTYNPALDVFKEGTSSRFDLPYTMSEDDSTPSPSQRLPR